MLKKYSPYAAIILAIALVVVITQGISCHKNDTLPPAPAVTDTATFQKRVRAVEEASQKKQDSLQDVADKEKQVSESYKGQLAKAQQNGRLMESVINNMPEPIDTSGLAQDRKAKIQEYFANSHLRDSLCNETIASQSRQLSTKDAQLSEKDLLYSKLRGTFDTAMTQHQLLIDDDKAVRKAFKNKNFGAKLWKGISVAEALYIVGKIVLKK